MTSSSHAQLRLWQLISPTLPIGAFAWSQGLEYAVEAQWVKDETSAREWILGQLRHNLPALDIPLLLRLYAAWQVNDTEKARYWNAMLLALRESSELHKEDLCMGEALIRVLNGLEVSMPGENTQWCYASVFAYACHYWAIDSQQAAQGFMWSWCENQVAAAVKLVPLGQTSGQRILSQAVDIIPAGVESAMQCVDDELAYFAPAQAIASALHETQYTRLFRS